MSTMFWKLEMNQVQPFREFYWEAGMAQEWIILGIENQSRDLDLIQKLERRVDLVIFCSVVEAMQRTGEEFVKVSECLGFLKQLHI